nr:hypothetical protein [Tanacetum cinerariifolium]
MNCVPDEAVVMTAIDRLSNLPLDLIHHILSLMDMKYAVQTCVLSSEWKHIWTSLRHIKFSTSEFQQLGQFIRFARHVIAHSNDQTDVSSLELAFGGTLSQILVKDLLNYVVSHNVHDITINTHERDRKIPICIFESQSLKHLTLINLDENSCIVPQYPWDLPNLTTLNLSQIVLTDGRIDNQESIDLFSKCANLNNLYLEECYMAGVKVFNVTTPRLESLSIKNCFINKIFISAPKLSSFAYKGEYPLSLSTNGFQHLDKVDLHMRVCAPHLPFKKEDAHQLVELFKNFRCAEFLNVYSNVIEHLHIYEVLPKEACTKFALPNHVRNYFPHSSPNATITTEVLK